MRGILLIAIAAMLWGTTGTSQALAPAGVTPLSVGALRILVGGLTLLALTLLRGGFRTRRRWNWRMVLFGAVFVAAYQPTFFGGTLLTGVAAGTMIGIGSAPLFAGLLSYFVDGERPSRQWALATAMAVGGCVVLVSADSGEFVIEPLGVLLALGAGLSYVLYTRATKSLVAEHPSNEVVAILFCLGAVFLLPLLLVSDMGWVASGGGLVVVLHLGVLATGLSYALYGQGMRTVSVPTTATLTLFEPLTAATLGIVVLGEVVNAQRLIGMALIFLGLVLLGIRRRRLTAANRQPAGTVLQRQNLSEHS